MFFFNVLLIFIAWRLIHSFFNAFCWRHEHGNPTMQSNKKQLPFGELTKERKKQTKYTNDIFNRFRSIFWPKITDNNINIQYIKWGSSLWHWNRVLFCILTAEKKHTHTHQFKWFHLFCQLVNWLWCPKLSKRHCCAFALHWIVSILIESEPISVNVYGRAPGQLTKQLNLHLLGVNCVCSNTCANTCTPFHVLIRPFK